MSPHAATWPFIPGDLAIQEYEDARQEREDAFHVCDNSRAQLTQGRLQLVGRVVPAVLCGANCYA